MTLSEKISNVATKHDEFISGLGEDFASLKKNSQEFLQTEIAASEQVEKILSFNETTLQKINEIREKVAKNKTEKSNELQQPTLINAPAIATDALNQVRNLTQSCLNGFDFTYSESTSKMLRAKVGTFWIESSKWLETINESSLIKNSRSNEIQLRTNQDTEKNLYVFWEIFFKEIANIDTQMLNGIVIEVEQKKKEIAGFEISTDIFILTKKSDAIIESVSRIETPYSGNYPKVNFRSLIIEVRSYSMMFILLVSTLGLNRQFEQNDSLMFGFYIISITLIAFGVGATYIKVQDTKVEKLEDEIKKVKERLSAETKRAANEFSTEWKAFIQFMLRGKMNELVAKAEFITKKFSNNKIDARQKINLDSQQLDSYDRNLQEHLRKAEAFRIHLQTLKTEISKNN